MTVRTRRPLPQPLEQNISSRPGVEHCGTCPGSTACARSRSPPCCCTTLTPAGCRGGFLGVDVFFVISGFLITSLLLGEWRDTAASPRPLLAARARRLLPALFLVLGVVRRWSRPYSCPRCAELRGDAIAALIYVDELAPDRSRTSRTSTRSGGPAAAAPVVAGGRGAVLPALAALVLAFLCLRTGGRLRALRGHALYRSSVISCGW